ncbi:MAG: hypothetical protein LT070_13935 [Solirubrobacteraceae bacterium]|nr:hypothetical protein [Solirubrobacteraceae bacterium]
MEVATFLADDPDVLVRASLACPVCLHGPGAVDLRRDGDDWWVECWCVECRNRRRVELSQDQALRLTVAPLP